ncbi:Hpt domain-containing protein [Desulfobulbus sp. F5]|nr:Hpt domain-containing protein [Desulfobulbus sp. F5]
MDDTSANEIAAEFLSEVEGYLPLMRGCLQTLRKDRGNSEAAAELHRMVHTIKGAAAMVGFDDLSQTGGLLEQVMDKVLESALIMDDELISLFSDTIQRIDAFCTLRSVEKQGGSTLLHQETLAAFQAKHRDLPPERDDAPAEKEPPVGADEDSIAGILEQLLSVNEGEAEEVFLLNENLEEHEGTTSVPVAYAIDPELMACFNEEATEHLENIDQQLKQLTASVIDKTPLSNDLRASLHSLRRSVHTLKGAAAVIGIEPVAAWGREFEDFLDWLHDEAPALHPQTLAAIHDGRDVLAVLAEDATCVFTEEQRAAAEQFRVIREESGTEPEPAAEVEPEATPPETVDQAFASEVEDFFAEKTENSSSAVLFDELFSDDDSAEDSGLFQTVEEKATALPAESAEPKMPLPAEEQANSSDTNLFDELFPPPDSTVEESRTGLFPNFDGDAISVVFSPAATEAQEVQSPAVRFREIMAAQTEQLPVADVSAAEEREADFFAEEPSDETEASLFDELPDAKDLFAATPEPAEEEDEAIDPELLECFSEETAEHLENIDQQLKELAAGVDGETRLSEPLRENLHSLRRSVHTLKGAAAVIGIKPVAAWGHEFEDFLDWLHDESPVLHPSDVAAMQEGADILARIADQPTISLEQDKQAAVVRFREIMATPVVASTFAAQPETADLPSAATVDVFFAEEEPLGTGATEQFELFPTADSAEEQLFAVEPQPDDVSAGDELFSATEDKNDSLFAPGPATESVAEDAIQAIDPELMQCFNEEAAEHLENIDQQLKELATGVDDETALSEPLRENLHSLRRSVHTLKGAAAVIGIEPVAAWGHEFEDFLDWLHDESPILHAEDVAAMQEGADLLVRITENPAVPVTEKKAAAVERFRKIIAGEKVQPQVAAAEPVTVVDAEEPAPAPLPAVSAEPVATSPVAESASLAPVPPASPPPVQEQHTGVRRINTLRVDISRIDQVVGLSGDMVINLSSFEASMSAMSGTLNELGMILQRLKSINHSLETGYELATIPYLRGMGDTTSGSLTEDFDPLEMDRYSELNILIRSLSEAVSDLDSIMAQSALENIAWERTVERQARVLKDIQNKMIGLRMTPLSVLSARMQRTLREAERSTGHPAQLIIDGESIMMDTRVWDTMADALMHILRNSVAHGGSSERQLTVRIKAERRGGQFSLRIKDDGKGLNYEVIRTKGMTLYPNERIGSMNDEKLATLIFRHGFSSAGSISSIAGRGVGMDVVRDSVELLNGSIEIFSPRGKGLELLIRLPVAVAQLHAVLVRLAGQTYAVPMHDISSAARVRPEDIVANECEVDGKKLPLLNPAAIPGFQVGISGEALPESELAVLAVQVGSRRAALLCEQIIGQRDIVFKDLGSHLSNVACIAGVTIMGDGSLIPILQIDDLLKKWAELTAPSAETEFVAEVQPQTEERPIQVLVVDDSISVRKVVSNFLLQHGWQPTIARNGIEALERIREEKPDLVLLDVEMPRMNGFEVLQALQSQPEFQDIPVVMLTSRSADKYREKASQLGARGFMTKPFKEDEAVELIRSMISGRIAVEMNE